MKAKGVRADTSLLQDESASERIGEQDVTASRFAGNISVRIREPIGGEFHQRRLFPRVKLKIGK
jgi:hypothetical protein